jgi:DHA1 family tetracycline resistance protein-like MFS transporter
MNLTKTKRFFRQALINLLLIGASIFASLVLIEIGLQIFLPSEEQGELQGSLMSLTSLASILNPLITTQLFAHFSGELPGAPYFFAALVCALSFPLVFHKRRAA